MDGKVVLVTGAGSGTGLAAAAGFARLGAQEQRLDVLVNNAGVMPDERTRTADGIEAMFATRVPRRDPPFIGRLRVCRPLC